MDTTRNLQRGITPAPVVWALALVLAALVLLAASPAASGLESPHRAAGVESSTCSSCHPLHAQLVDGSMDLNTGAVCLSCHTTTPVASESADPLTRHDLGPDGTMYCAACHAPHNTSAATRTVNPLDRSVLLPSALTNIVNGDGAVYALVASQNDSKAPVVSVIRSFPSDVSAAILWTTDERATSWVDWRLATQPGGSGWGQPFGSASLTQSHAVTMTGLTPATTYVYRVRSSDALGNTTTSADRTFTTQFPYEEFAGAAVTTATAELAPTPTAASGTSPSPATDAALVYADEFDGPLETSVWQNLTPWKTRYTTGELQYYAPGNVSFENGNMRILTERRAEGGYDYTSGIVTSLDKPFSYGYFESRFKMPTGKGLWPAFWLTNDRTHEIDMMELLGEDPNRMYFTYHKGGEQLFQQYFDDDTDLTTGWHTVGMDWQPTHIRWYLDGQLVAEHTGDIISDPMYLIFNTAVGGAWAVDPDASTPFPQTFEIDYVRVYDRLSEESLAVAAGLAEETAVWRDTHLENTLYSVDTDRIALAVDGRDGERSWLAPSAGWQSAGADTAKPRPSAPGAPVDAAVLERAKTADGQYWRTALADVDRQWNWQVIRFDLGAADISSLESLSLLWSGHGEPTAGYPTALYVWESGDWKLVSQREAPEDISVSLDRSSVDESFCLSCHQGTAPEGVIVPAEVTNVGAGWQSDVHGWGTGDGSGGELREPYARASEAIQCDTCHDPHGSSSIYHIPESVNGLQTTGVTSGAKLGTLCVSCHEGSLNNWHSACVDCHNNGHWAGWVDPPVERLLPTENSDCTQCHGHSQSWTHPATCLRCHGETELRALNATPDQPWTYSHTF